MEENWVQTVKFGIAKYPFSPISDHCLPLSIGDEVHIFEECGDWFRGFVLPTNEQGIFPKAFVKVKSLEEAKTESLVDDVTSTLRDWANMLNVYYYKRNYIVFTQVKTLFDSLLERKFQLQSELENNGVVSESVRKSVLAKMEEGRQLMELDVIPRNAKGEKSHEKNTNLVPLYRMHDEVSSVDTGIKPKKAKDDKSGDVQGQLYLTFHTAICPVGEETQLIFSLYSHTEKKFISENYIVNLTFQGAPQVEKIGKLKTLFTDLGQRELNSRLFVVCRMIRKGRMVYEDKKEKTQNKFRRPFAVGILEVFPDTMVAAGCEDETLRMEVFSSTSEQGFVSLHEHIIENTGSYEPVPMARGILISLRLLKEPVENATQEKYPFLCDTVMTHKLGFPDVVLPGEVRNDLYFTLDCAEIQSAGVHVARNIEVSLKIIKKNGQVIPKCISNGSDEFADEFCTVVYYHTNSPKWMETVNIRLDTAMYSEAHAFFSFRHCSSSDKKHQSESEFGFGFVNLLSSQGTVIEDGKHTLNVFKPVKTSDKVFYLHEEVGSKMLQMRKNESFTLNVQLCSTKLTQNFTLMNLLDWKKYPDELGGLLKMVTFIDQVEIVKFLQEIFDALFAILDSRTEEVSILVFNALVFIIGILVDERSARYANFRPVLDVYIREHFTGAMAHRHLVNCLRYYVTKGNSVQHASHIRSSMKALEYLFKFIYRSRQLYAEGQGEKLTEEKKADFKKDLISLFDAFNTLLAMKEPEHVIGAQTIGLKCLARVFENVSPLFTSEEMARLLSSLVRSSRYHPQKKQHTAAFLLCLTNLTASPLFADQTIRDLFLPSVRMALIRHYGNTPEEQLACASILLSIMELMERSETAQALPGAESPLAPQDRVPGEIWKLSPLWGRVMAHFIALPATAENKVLRIQLEIWLLTLLHSMTDCQFAEALGRLGREGLDDAINLQGGDDTEEDEGDLLIADMRQLALKEKEGELEGEPSPDACHTFFSNILKFFEIVVHPTDSPLPKEWLLLHLLARSCLLKILRLLAPVMLEKFTGDAFSKELWGLLFALALDTVGCEFLQVERAFLSRRKLILSIYGDMRIEFAALVKSCWEKLKDHRIHFIPELVYPFLNMSLVAVPQVQTTGLLLYNSMLRHEFVVRGNFNSVEKETIDALDRLSKSENASAQFLVFFTDTLKTLFTAKEAVASGLSPVALSFLTDMTHLLRLLLELRGLPSGPEYEDDRTIATLAIMEYLKQTGRTDTYIKYVAQLCEMHVAAGNFIEAALTLLLHADLLAWDNTVLGPILDFPKQTARHRKIAILERCVDLMDKGKAWERAIILLKELRHQFEKVLYDYTAVGRVLRKQAEFYVQIQEQERFFSEYFRVAYYGRGFNASLQNKAFIYRGAELERLPEFVARITAKFPNAEILTYSTEPSAETKNSDGQYIQIYNVQPSSKAESEGRELEEDFRLPKNARKYLRNNSVGTFLYSRPVQKGTKAQIKENEFATLWIENSYMHTANTFPTFHRRSEILSTTVQMCSPLRNALLSIKGKNCELRSIVDSHAAPDAIYTSPFTMAMNGTVDAAVNGGVTMYKKAFFNLRYLEDNPDAMPDLDLFKKLLSEQLEIVSEGLTAHGRICPQDLHGLHNHLTSSFEKMKADLTESILEWTPEKEAEKATATVNEQDDSVSAEPASLPATESSEPSPTPTPLASETSETAELIEAE